MRNVPAANLAALALLLVAAGCAAPLHVDPGYRNRVYDAPGPAPLRDVPRPAAFPGDTPESPAVDDRPIEALALHAARDLALQRNHTVAAATAAVLAAEARIAEARAAFLPTLAFGATRTVNSETRSITIQGGPSFSLSPEWVTTGQANLSLSLFAFGRDWEAVHAARAAIDTTILDERSARQRLLYEVTQGWYRVHEADAQVLVADDALASAARQLEDAENILRAERATRDAVLTAQVEKLQKEQERLVARNAAIHARRVLNVLLVREPDAPLGLAAAPEFRAAVVDVARLEGWAREHNPGLLSFRTRRAALEHQRESVERSFAPEITGALGAEYTNFKEATGYATNYTASLGVQWTPVQGGRRIGRLAEIHAELAGLRERELQAIQDLGLQIHRAVLDLQEAESAAEVARRSIEAATENHRIISDRFKAGKTTAREVLEAQQTLTRARFQFNRARFVHRTLLALLESLVGVEMSEWLPEAP